MAKRKAKKRTGTHHRRRSHRTKSHGLLGAMPDNAMEKILGIGAGAAGAGYLEEMIERHKPGMNPLLIGAGEVFVGGYMSSKPGIMGSVGDGIIAAGALNLASAIRGRMKGHAMHGPEYVINGDPQYVTGADQMYITEDGYVITGANEYVIGEDGHYITENEYHAIMGDVNQGGLGDVNQGGLGDY